MKRSIMMLGLLVVSASALVQAGCDDCSCRTNSQTFMPIRPPFQVSSPERLAHFRDDRVERKQDGWLGAVQVVPLGGKLLNEDNLAKYFLPTCKTSLNINEVGNSSVIPDGTDVIAEYLNIYTTNGNFSSRVCFEFNHSFVGAGFYYQQEFYHSHSGRAAWFSVSFPVLQVRNSITLNEQVINDGGGVLAGPVASGATPATGSCSDTCASCIQSDSLPTPRAASVVEAFAQPGWCFGKIVSGQTNKVTKVADVELRLAYQIASNEHSHMESWAGVVIPTGNTPQGVYVFEPIVGNHGHYAAILGSSFGVHVWENECRSLSIYTEFDFNIQYFWSHKEVRQLDLKNKPWSRYMQFYNLAQATVASTTADPSIGQTIGTPGVNVLTKELKVKPGFARTFNVAWDILWRCFEFEIGYNFYARQAECVELCCPLGSNIALKNVVEGDGETAKFALINDIDLICMTPFADYSQNVLTNADINLWSAAAPAMLSHTLYASAAYDWSVCDYPILTSIGGSYEFCPDNTGMNRWMAFGKLGVSF